MLLAGITISALTGNGLFEKEKLAKQKYTEAEAREKIELLLNEYQIEKIDNEELSLYEYFNQKKEEGKIDTLKDNGNGTIKVGVGEYTVTINIEKLTITNIEITNDIEFLYELTSYENNKFKILIKIIDKTNGIDTIKFPDGDIQQCNGKEEVGIDYEVDEGVDYIFIAKNSNGTERREVINLIKPANPEIDIPNFETPTFTLTGIKNGIPKVTINYDEREEFVNYYSLDDGQTWILYTEPIIASTEKIKAKSENKKCIGIVTETTAIIEQSGLKVAGYDCNLDTVANCQYQNQTYENLGHGYNFDFNVDNSTWGTTCSIVCKTKQIYGYSRTVNIAFLDNSKNLIEEKNIGIYTGQKLGIKFEIPLNAYTIVFSNLIGEEIGIYEISINDPIMPKIKVEYEEDKANKTILEYPVLTLNGLVNCSVNPELGSKVKLEIQAEQLEGVEVYYSLDAGKTWNIYNNIIETTYKEEGLIQVKGVNKYYRTQSDINILKNYIVDEEIPFIGKNIDGIGYELGKEAFDGDLETSISLIHHSRIDVDESFSGKKLFIKYLSNGIRTVNFYNSEGTFVHHTPNGENGVREVSMLMPIDTRTIYFGYGDRDLLYEIGYNYNYIVTPL